MALNYMIDTAHAVIVDVEATPARTYDEVAATRTMIERTGEALGLKPINEEARDYARSLKETPEFAQSSDERKKVEMRFAHLTRTFRRPPRS
jgi:hypothetical protein